MMGSKRLGKSFANKALFFTHPVALQFVGRGGLLTDRLSHSANPRFTSGPVMDLDAAITAPVGFDAARRAISHVRREARVHHAELVAKLGTYLLHSHGARLGEEVWAAYEQVYVALLEHGKHPKPVGNAALELAQEYGNALSERFPESLRVKRLEGLMWEAKAKRTSPN